MSAVAQLGAIKVDAVKITAKAMAKSPNRPVMRLMPMPASL
jgi:hypothetical protein